MCLFSLNSSIRLKTALLAVREIGPGEMITRRGRRRVEEKRKEMIRSTLDRKDASWFWFDRKEEKEEPTKGKNERWKEEKERR